MWFVLGLAPLLAVLSLRIPLASLTATIDDSCSGVLVYAREQGLQFGHDIVFTFGPLGIMSAPRFSPWLAFPRLGYEVLTSCGLTIGLCLLARRMTVGWRVVFLGAFILVSATVHSGGDDFLLDLSLFSWGLVCWLESGRRLKLFVFYLAGFGAMCALIKFNLLVNAGMTITLLACDLALRGRRGLAALAVPAFVLGWLAGWMLLGQSLSNLGVFFLNSLAITFGYNQTVSLENYDWAPGLLLVALAFAAAMIRVSGASLPGGEHPRLRRGLLMGWLAGFFFLQWKHGFVRADQMHVACFIGVVSLAALALAAVPLVVRPMESWERVIAVGGILVAFFLLHDMNPGFPVMAARLAPERAAQNLGALLRPEKYLRDQSKAYSLEQSGSQLPKIRGLIGRATTDVFGQIQMFALFNELNYRPRPVFQSYSTFNRRLMELNSRFYTSTNAPEFVLFSLRAIDKRFPPLEDATLLRDLLVNYTLAGDEGDYLLLRRRQTEPVRLAPIRETDVRPGVKIVLDEFGGDSLWMELDVRPSLLGRLRSLLFKPPKMQLYVWKEGRSSPDKRFRAPAPMLAAGFLASPLELNNQDVLDLYHGKPPVPPKAYSIEFPPGTANFWQDQIHVRIYRIGNRLGD